MLFVVLCIDTVSGFSSQSFLWHKKLPILTNSKDKHWEKTQTSKLEASSAPNIRHYFCADIALAMHVPIPVNFRATLNQI